MKRLRVLFLVAAFLICWVGSALSEGYNNVTFQKSQSYELADILTIFAPTNGSNELDWIGIKYAENFKTLYRTDDVPKPKGQYVFGGYVGLLFNGNGLKTSSQYWDNGILKETTSEVGYTSMLSFYCPVWNGYNHLNVGINLPPNKVSYLLTGSSSGNFEENLSNYLEKHNIKLSVIEKYTDKYYDTKYLYRVSCLGKSSTYLIIDSWAGSGGVLGHINLDLYLNLKTAKSELTRAK